MTKPEVPGIRPYEPDPNTVEFYTSGRASNESSFLYQIFAREYGSGNFPDCSNMCHEPTGVGLPQSIGIGKGTVSLDDFGHCEMIISIGHNPATNHPRMMGTLWTASGRGLPIVVINPLRERGLERCTDPQDPAEMLTGLIADYDRIRAAIASVFTDFGDYNARVRLPGGFRLPLPPTERKWTTPSGTPGSVAAYYPEANALVPPEWTDQQSGIPACKSVPVHVFPADV